MYDEPRSINIILNGESHTVYGGPYRQVPGGMEGVKMAAEIDMPCRVDIPTVDFSVPDMHEFRQGLKKALVLMVMGKTIYVGCMGGIGRTGLFLAALSKVMMAQNPSVWSTTSPVAYVRANYMGHAVETDQQKQFINELDVQSIARLAKVF